MIFVGANRVGTEEGMSSFDKSPVGERRSLRTIRDPCESQADEFLGTTFVGTNCVMTVSTCRPSVDWENVANISEERVMIATIA